MGERHSLWLIPDPGSGIHGLLEDLIQRYNDSYGESVSFQPHVTLTGKLTCGEEEARDAVASLAERHDTVELTLVRPHCSTTYFQCVFLLVEPTEDLLELNRDAAEACGREPYFYVPHLSLLYGDIPVQTRQELVDGFDTGMLPLSFTAQTLRLMDTTGNVDNWEFIEDYSLS